MPENRKNPFRQALVRDAVEKLWLGVQVAGNAIGVTPGELLVDLMHRAFKPMPERDQAAVLGLLVNAMQPKTPPLVPKPPTLGDAPIEGRYHAHMVWLGRIIDQVFNGRIGGPDRETGFILLVFPFSTHEGRCNYLSNGADRDDVVVLLREQLARFEGVLDHEGHA